MRTYCGVVDAAGGFEFDYNHHVVFFGGKAAIRLPP